MEEYSLEELMRRYGNDVFKMACYYVKESHMAEDIFQDVFLRVHQNLGSFRGESSIRTWILRITINACKDYLKSAYHYRVVPMSGEEERTLAAADPYEAVEKKRDLQYVRDALSRLPSKDREILMLLYFEECSVKEAAGLLGIREGTVKSRLSRARSRLKKELEARQKGGLMS